MIDALYSQRILEAAANMPRTGRLVDPDASCERTAKLCGSRIRVDIIMDGSKVTDFAQEVSACALGQAAAAVLGERIVGADIAEIELARDALNAMLKTDGSPPQGRFAELAMLQIVKDYPARHASTLLAFETASEVARMAMSATTSRTRSTDAA